MNQVFITNEFMTIMNKGMICKHFFLPKLIM